MVDINKIIDDASTHALRSFFEKTPSSTDLDSMPEDVKELMELYTPIIKYIDSLVAESLRLYHQQSLKD